jgi:hypothetical protein
MSLLDVYLQSPIDYSTSLVSNHEFEVGKKHLSDSVQDFFEIEPILPGVSWQALASTTLRRSSILVYFLGLVAEKIERERSSKKRWNIPNFEADWLCAGTSESRNLIIYKSTEGATTWVPSEEQAPWDANVLDDTPLMAVPLESYGVRFVFIYQGDGPSVLQNDADLNYE